MKIYLDKHHFRIGTENHFNLIYLWWGLEPWAENPKRVFEFGIGYRSWQIFK